MNITKADNKWINPIEGIITSSFGDRLNPILNKSELHNGLDIAAKEGTEVFAVQNGTVIEVDKSNTYGNYIKYKTDNGLVIMYAHLQKSIVKVNSKVKKGKVVAYSGNTGLSTGPHLHYTIFKNGKEIDPMPYVDLPHTTEVKDEYVMRGENIK